MANIVNRIQIANISLPAKTATPWALPKGCKWFTLQCRSSINVRVSKAQGMGTYFTLKSGASWDEHDLDIGERLTLFLYAASAVVVEVFLGIYDEEV